MKKKYLIIIIIVFNLVLASAFYIQGLSAKVTDLSGDLANIVPICIKLDNPNLFKNDLYLNDINNVKYYIPFYIETLRFFAKFTDYNYVQALNLLGFFTHFVFGILWFLLLFKLKNDFWIAFIFSIFFRGVTWPPGMELLGISDIWTIMPRTIFLALLPLPFIIYTYFTQKWQFLAAITLGVLVNFHPISGIGCALVYFSLLIAFLYFEKKLVTKQSLIKIIWFGFLVFIGMLPYLISYVTNVKTNINVNKYLFNEAFNARLSNVFFDTTLFLKSWLKPVTYFFTSCFILFYFFDTSTKKRYFKILFFAIFVLFVFCNSIIFIEKFINIELNINFRFSFQLVRAQKFILILFQIATFLLFCNIIKYLKFNEFKKIVILLFYISFISLSTTSFFKKIPLLGEDITTYIFPNNLKIAPLKAEDKSNVLQIHDFVNKNTKINDVFYFQDIFFRTATKRSEVFDFHAAGMIIEGNPVKYTDYYFTLKKFNKSSEIEKIKILKNKKVNYFVVQEKWKLLNPIFYNSKYYVYKIN